MVIEIFSVKKNSIFARNKDGAVEQYYLDNFEFEKYIDGFIEKHLPKLLGEDDE